MIRRQYVSGSSDEFPFRITVTSEGGSEETTFSGYSIDFRGRSNLSAVSYHLSASSAGATVISVPYTALLASGQVVRGTFDIRQPDGEFVRSEPLHITVR
jgi:hypothetical protein